MSYTGDAYLTLRTRVQANPLNTYLSTKPSFASPQPLAASSGLTIPLQINLSDVRMSGFVILVFSRQKGITLVFRNDPLESLKVSSTFDTIPFVRDYLQKEIEGQLRVLFMDDLPAIIHRLSLRMCTPDYQHQQDNDAQTQREKDVEQPFDPLASPPQNPLYDSFINPLDQSDLASLSSPDSSHQTHATFSRKNLLRLATLDDSHRTLSLFTPPIRDAVFRAWAGAAERGENSNTSPRGPVHGLTHGALSRQHSATTSRSGSVYSFSDAASAAASSASRPTLSSMTSAYSFNNAGRAGGRPTRKRKHRIVDLRKAKPEEGAPEAGTEGTAQSRPTTPTSTSASSRDAAHSASEPREGELITPPDSPENKTPRPKARLVEPLHATTSIAEILSPQPRPTSSSNRLHSVMLEHTVPGTAGLPFEMHEEPHTLSQRPAPRQPIPQPQHSSTQSPTSPTKAQRHRPDRPRHLHSAPRTQSLGPEKLPTLTHSASSSTSSTQPAAPSGSILEQAWMMKMATEIARKVREEKGQAQDGALEVDLEATPRPLRAGTSTRFGAGGVGSAEEATSQVERSPPPAYKA